MSHIWISHVSHMNGSRPTYEWVMSHIQVSHIHFPPKKTTEYYFKTFPPWKKPASRESTQDRHSFLVAICRCTYKNNFPFKKKFRKKNLLLASQHRTDILLWLLSADGYVKIMFDKKIFRLQNLLSIKKISIKKKSVKKTCFSRVNIGQTSSWLHASAQRISISGMLILIESNLDIETYM